MKAEPWTQLDSKEVLHHPKIHLKEDTVKLPDGRITSYLRQAPTKTHSVAIIAINDKHEMLLQKEYSYPPDQIMWQLPGGTIQEGESILLAANRELSEESGFIGKSCQEIGSYYLDNRRSDMRQHIILCTDLEAKGGERDEEEFIETYWLPISNLQAMVASGEFNSAPLLAALHVYFSRMAEAIHY